MIYAQPGTAFTTIAEDFSTGLVGTIGVRLENADGSNNIPRTTAGIVELEAGSGIYLKSLTAPVAEGTYVVIWDAGGIYASEELSVTDAPLPSDQLADFTFSKSHPFPDGTTVTIYADRGQQRDVAPAGDPITTAVVGTGSVLTVTGLAEGERYLATAVVNGARRTVGFYINPDPDYGEPGEPVRAAALYGLEDRVDDLEVTRTVEVTQAELDVVESGRVYVDSYGADPTGAADSTAAINAAIAAAGADGVVVFKAMGTYLHDDLNQTFNGQVWLAWRTVFKARSNSVKLIHWSGARGAIRGRSKLDANGKTGATGLRLTPADEAQTTTLTDQSLNSFDIEEIGGFAEGLVMATGPRVGGADSKCFYNRFHDIRFYNCIRAIWKKNSTTSPGANPNRNQFYSCGVSGAGQANTGLQVDAGDTDSYYGCSFEGIQNGTSPNATPTAVKIAATGNGGDNNNNRFYGATFEACTRDIDNANATSQFIGHTATTIVGSANTFSHSVRSSEPIYANIGESGQIGLGDSGLPIVNYGNSVAAGSVPNNSVFRDSADNVIKQKNSAGTVRAPALLAIPVRFDLFAAIPGMGFSLSAIGTSYGFLTAVTASTVQFTGEEVARVIVARVKFIWTPNGAGSGLKLQKFDDGPTNIVDVYESTGRTETTPVISEADITTDMQERIDATGSKHFGFVAKRDAVTPPTLYAVWIQAVLGVA